MLRSFDSLALRQLLTRRLRAALTAFGIVLGVGMVFAVLVLASTIRHTFDELISSAWGKTDLAAVSKSGGQIPAGKLAELRAVPGVAKVSPMVGVMFRRLHPDGSAIKGAGAGMLVAGIEPDNPPYDFHFLSGSMVAKQGMQIDVEQAWAQKHGLRLGEAIAVATPTGRARLQIVGLFRFSKGLSFGEMGFAGISMATARQLSGQENGYMQISFQARDRSRVRELQQHLQRVLGSGVDVKTPQGFSDQLAKQLQGLNVVLYFFSGVALFVGGFLILNGFNMTVLQRMREIGMLRTLGATRLMIVRSVLLEAIMIGGVGTTLGLGLGLALSEGLIKMISSIGVPVGALQMPASALFIAVALGLVVTLLGALMPARRAGRIEPIRAVLGDAEIRRGPSVRRAAVGLALFVPGVLFGGSFWFSDSTQGSTLGVVGGIALTMAMFIGMTLAAPYLIMPFVRALSLAVRRLSPTAGRLATDATRSNPARTAATAVALTIGLSVVVVNSGISTSMLHTINRQIDAAYARDFTIQPLDQILGQSGQAIATPVAKRIAKLPGVGVVTPIRATVTQLPGRSSDSTPGLIMAVDPAAWGNVDHTPISGSTRAQALAGVARGGVIASKGYAAALNLHVGSQITLHGPGSSRRARVVGLLDAATTGMADSMQISLATMSEVYGITEDSQLAVTAASPAQRTQLGREIQALLARDYPNLEAASTAQVKSQIQSAVNRQFNLFNAILAVAVVISLLGVINTLAISVIERTREIGVLRALGSSRWQVRSTMLDESLLITVGGALAGILLGSVIAFFWIQGMDTFMPGISFAFPVATTITITLAAIVLGVLAAILPARRAARLDPIAAIAYE
ncbi:MAG TPA: FtsX-like permease family protein [Solirubrobacteraceae bacterium]